MPRLAFPTTMRRNLYKKILAASVVIKVLKKLGRCTSYIGFYFKTSWLHQEIMATKIFEQFHFSYTVDYHDNSSIVSKSSMAKIWLDSVVFLLCSFVDLLAPPRALIVTLTFWRPSRTHPHRSSIINPSYSIHIWRQLGTTWELHEQHLGTTIWRHLGFPNWDNFETPFGTILSHFLGHLCDTLWVGGGPFQKNKSYPHFLMLWSLYNRYLTLKMVSLQN